MKSAKTTSSLIIMTVKLFRKSKFSTLLFLFVSIVLLQTNICYSAPNCITLFSKPKNIEMLLQGSNRPQIQNIVAISNSKAALDLINRTFMENEAQVFEIIFTAAKNIIKKSDGRDVYIFARDGEGDKEFKAVFAGSGVSKS